MLCYIRQGVLNSSKHSDLENYINSHLASYSEKYRTGSNMQQGSSRHSTGALGAVHTAVPSRHKVIKSTLRKCRSHLALRVLCISTQSLVTTPQAQLPKLLEDMPSYVTELRSFKVWCSHQIQFLLIQSSPVQMQFTNYVLFAISKCDRVDIQSLSGCQRNLMKGQILKGAVFC